MANAGNDGAILVFASLLSFFMNGAYAGLYSYTPEVYPTAIRSTGMGAASAFGRVGGIAAPIIIGSAYANLGFAGVFVLTTVVLFVGVLSVLVLGLATAGRTLEEISEVGVARPTVGVTEDKVGVTGDRLWLEGAPSKRSSCCWTTQLDVEAGGYTEGERVLVCDGHILEVGARTSPRPKEHG